LRFFCNLFKCFPPEKKSYKSQKLQKWKGYKSENQKKGYKSKKLQNWKGYKIKKVTEVKRLQNGFVEKMCFNDESSESQKK